MHEGIDAERAMRADQPGVERARQVEARPPHQRAIAEHPEVARRDRRRVMRVTPNRSQFGTAWMSALRNDLSLQTPHSSGLRSAAHGRSRTQAGPGAQRESATTMLDPQPATRRRLWPVFVPFALLVALAVIWTGLWFYAASRGGDRHRRLARARGKVRPHLRMRPADRSAAFRSASRCVAPSRSSSCAARARSSCSRAPTSWCSRRSTSRRC